MDELFEGAEILVDRNGRSDSEVIVEFMNRFGSTLKLNWYERKCLTGKEADYEMWDTLCARGRLNPTIDGVTYDVMWDDSIYGYSQT